MTQTPAGWFVDPQDATQFRYWDGAAWTEHRSPRGPTTTDQLNQAGADLADGLAKGFTAMGNWVNQNTALAPAGVPTFASVAASCRDEPARQPLSVNAHLVLAPTDLAGIAAVFAQAPDRVTPEGATLDNEHCRLVPNPWNPQDPNGVAVFVGLDPWWAGCRPTSRRRTARRWRSSPAGGCSPPASPTSGRRAGPARSPRPG